MVSTLWSGSIGSGGVKFVKNCTSNLSRVELSTFARGMACDEEHAFHERCGDKVRAWNAMRSRQQYHRGLLIHWRPLPRASPGSHGFGVGHLLELAFRMHRVCIELDRYCYVRIYDAEFDQYFGYADGHHWATQHWAPQPEELAKYPIDRREKLSLVTDGHEHADLVSRNLSSILRAPTYEAASLISLSIRGLPPTYKSESTAAMKRLSISGAMDSREPTNATLHHLDGLDPCLCRYVTQPRLRDRPAPTPFPRTAIHFRTNMADLQSKWLPPPRPHERSNGADAPSQPAPARRWAEAACPSIHGEDGGVWREPVFIASDSLGLMRALRDIVGRGIVRTLEYAQSRTNSSSTRTWDVDDLETKFRALDVIVAMGRSRTLLVAPQKLHCFCKAPGLGTHAMRQRGVADCPRYSLGGMRYRNGTGRLRRRCDERHWSTFYRPLITRSMCITSVGLRVPGCDRFPQTFLRDLPAHLRRISHAALPTATPRAKQQLKAASVELAMDGLRRSLGGSNHSSSLARQPHPCDGLEAVECYRQMIAVEA